jgi:hypothetical protein
MVPSVAEKTCGHEQKNYPNAFNVLDELNQLQPKEEQLKKDLQTPLSKAILENWIRPD